MNKIPNLFLYPTPVILATKIMVHLRATWIHGKTGAMELLEDLFSKIFRLGNDNLSLIPKTTIRVKGPVFVTCIRLYPIPDGQYLHVLYLGLDHSAQSGRRNHYNPQFTLSLTLIVQPELSHSLKHLPLPRSHTNQHSP